MKRLFAPGAKTVPPSSAVVVVGVWVRFYQRVQASTERGCEEEIQGCPDSKFCRMEDEVGEVSACCSRLGT